MYLNREHVYRFIKYKFGIKKQDLAKMMRYDSSNLSPKRPYDLERLYDVVFKVDDKEREIDILNELHDFIINENIENNLVSIRGMGYEEFVKEILRRANVSPPEKLSALKKSLPKRSKNRSPDDDYVLKMDDTSVNTDSNESVIKSELRDIYDQINRDYRIDECVSQIQELLKRAIEDHHILDLIINSESFDEDSLVDIDKFQDEIDTRIKSLEQQLKENLDDLKEDQLEERYKHKLYIGWMGDEITAFSTALKDHVKRSRSSSELGMAWYPVGASELDDSRNRLISTLNKLLGNNNG